MCTKLCTHPSLLTSGSRIFAPDPTELCLVTQLCLTLGDPMDYSPPGSSVHGDSPGKNMPCPPPRDLPNPGIKPRSPTLQGEPLPSEPPGKPRNIGVDSLSLLQGIFPNWSRVSCIVGDSLPAELPGKLYYQLIIHKMDMLTPKF